MTLIPLPRFSDGQPVYINPYQVAAVGTHDDATPDKPRTVVYSNGGRICTHIALPLEDVVQRINDAVHQNATIDFD